MLRKLLRSFAPAIILGIFRWFKRRSKRKKISKQIRNGNVLTLKDLELQFQNLGLRRGDDVLVHCALSKIGAIENGPQTFIEALKNVIGQTGNILMPSSPNASFQLDFIKNLSLFDVQNTPSKMGAISETFRTNENIFRSAHPTEPVCVWGKDADWYTKGHENDETAYGKNSPFYKLTEKGGKILYIGVTLDNAGTSLHVLEDAIVNFKYPVYVDEIFTVIIKNGAETKSIRTKVHNPEQSKKRKCDGLLPLFVQEGVARKGSFGKAETWVFDAKKMLDSMIKNYNEKGVTMYTPQGE